MAKIIFVVLTIMIICVLAPVLVGIGVHFTTNYN